MKRLMLSSTDKKIAGVCGGLGQMVNVDPTLIRLGFVFVGIATGVVPLVAAYLIAWIIVPEESPPAESAPGEPAPAGTTRE